MTPSIVGARIRERRRDLGITQTSLAGRIGISPSYLNLIENNKRPVAGVLLRNTAEALGLRLEDLDGAVERRLLATLDELALIPEIAALGVEAQHTGELIGHYPGWSRAVVALARSKRKATEVARALADRLTRDAFLGEAVHRMLTGIAAVRAAGEILVDHPDIDATQQSRFHRVVYQQCHSLTEVGEILAAYFEKADEGEWVLTPLDEVEALFEARGNHFEEIESAAAALANKLIDPTQRSRYQEARALAERSLKDEVNRIIAGQPQIETQLAQAREALLVYAAGALLAPMNVLLPEAKALAFDVEALAESFSISIDIACQRLSALPRDEGVPRFGYFQANAAGAIVAIRSLPGLSSPRYASACPLWVLYRAQQSPESLIRQRAVFPSGARFVFLARVRHFGPAGFGKPRHYLTDMLAISEQDAKNTVYAPDNSVLEEPVGSTCRSCPRQDCLHRVVDPLTG